MAIAGGGFWGKVFRGFRDHRAPSRRSYRALTKAVMESLEPRILLSTYIVTSNGDSGSGTLRYGIQNASGNETIQFNLSPANSTIDLTTGALVLGDTSGTLTIQGPTNQSVRINAINSGAFVVSSNVKAAIENLTITGGNAPSGGGINNSGTLTIVDSTISGNSASGGNGVYNGGGGIYNARRASLYISNSTISGNTSAGLGGGLQIWGYATINTSTLTNNSGNVGGGVYDSNVLTLNNCTISYNSASVNGGGIGAEGVLTINGSTIESNYAGVYGGGIRTEAALTITASLIDNNSSGNSGGGISNDAQDGGFATITNSTFSGNTTQQAGGAISTGGTNYASSQAPFTITNCTFAGNSASYGGAIADQGVLNIIDSTLSGNISSVAGGGIYIDTGSYGSPVVTLNGTIIAGSTHSDISKISGTLSGTYNLIGDGSGLTGPTNLQGEPTLSPLGYYGGPTETIAPLPVNNNQALGHGYSDSLISTDQRGMVRGSTLDIGAFQTQGSMSLVVNTLQDDAVNGGIASGVLSLRDAVNLADAYASATGTTEAITFAPTLSGTIVLNGTAIGINNAAGSVVIDEPQLGVISVSGGNSNQDFTINSTATATIEGLTLTNGNGTPYGYGGAVDNSGNLTISNSIVSNSTGSYAGGIYNSGTLNVTDSTVTGNNGGGIYNYGNATVSDSNISGNFSQSALANYGDITISNTTISGNLGNGSSALANGGTASMSFCNVTNNSATSGWGGAIGNAGVLTITDSTFSLNSATAGSAARGGAIVNSGTITIENCTFDHNSAAFNGGAISNTGVLTAINSTFTGNAAVRMNGSAPVGGAIWSSGSAVIIIDCTIYNNSAFQQFGGIYATQLSLQGSIVADNQNGDLRSGTHVTGSYDMIGDGTGGIGGSPNHNILGSTSSPIDPLLAPLGNYGGPTETMALLPGSPALSNPGFGDSSITADQRGYARPTDTASNIGAFQVEKSVPYSVGNLDGNGSIANGFTGSFFLPWGLTMTVNRVRESSLDVVGKLTIVAGEGNNDSSHTSYLNSLTIAQYSDGTFAGTLDLNNNSLIISTDSASAQQATLNYVRLALLSGYNGGAWNGTGIISTSDRANSSFIGLGLFTSNVGSDYEVVIMNDVVGDTNQDGIVNGVDFGTVAANFNKPGSSWDDGDFDYDGLVNGVDFAQLAANLNKGITNSTVNDNTFSPRLVASFSDSDNQPASDYSAMIHWGDGTPTSLGAVVADGNGTYEIIGEHTYPAGGTFDAQAIVTDVNGQTFQVTGSVNALDLPAFHFQAPTTVEAGANYQLECSATFPPTDGSDTVLLWFVNLPNGQIIQTTSGSVNTSLNYNGGNPVTITVVALDADGYAYTSLVNTIVTLAPPIVSAAGATSVAAGNNYNYTFNAAIPAADSGLTNLQSETINWDDGGSPVNITPVQSTVVVGHSFAHTGPHTVEWIVTDTGGQTSNFSATVNAINAPAVQGTWLPMTDRSLQTGGYPPLTLLMTNGDVIGTPGDLTGTWYQLTPSSSGSFVDQSWTPLASSDPRIDFASQMLPSGQVLTAGGEFSGFFTGSGIEAEIFTPSASGGSWAAYPIPGYLNNNGEKSISDSESALLPDGRVLIWGDVLGNQPGTYIFDPNYLSENLSTPWSLGTAPQASQDEASWVTLPGGQILTVEEPVTGSTEETAEEYIPQAGGPGTWMQVSGPPVSVWDGGETGPAVLLPTGKAIFFGGTSQTAIFDPSTSTWTAGPVFPTDLNGFNPNTSDASATVLPNGNVLLFCKSNDTSDEFFEYDWASNSIVSLAGAPTGISDDGGGGTTQGSLMLNLPDGGVLFAGGGYEFKPGGSASSSWQPVIDSVEANSDGTFNLTGTLLTGLDQGAAEGDDAQMATNYPLVRLTSTDGTQVYYATTSNWRSFGANQLESVRFALPSGLPSGTFSLQVVTNGIASSPVTFVQDTTSSNNNYVFRVSPTDSTQDQLLRNTTPIYSAAVASIPELILNLESTDTLTVDGSNGNPAPAAGITINGGTVVVNLGTGTSASIRPDTASVTIDSGTVTVPMQPSGEGVQSFHVDNLDIASSASLVMLSPASRTDRSLLTVSSLSIAAAGTLDLGGNELLVDYGGGADPIMSIASNILAGYNGGLWNGTGITSSKAAATDSNTANYQYGLGYADYADSGNPAGLASGQLEVIYTLYGDADLNGTVNSADQGILQANFNKAVTGWDEGDFNYDGIVNQSDSDLLTANLNQNVP